MYKINTIKTTLPLFTFYNMQAGFFCGLIMLLLYGCNSSSGNGAISPPPPQALPVITIRTMPATLFQEYSASLEGSEDIEIRPQVNGYIDKIYIDEGAHVRRGQPLFHVNDHPYREQLNNARAGLIAAKSNLATAQINVSRLTPLVESNIISDVQLKTAQTAYNASAATVSQAEAMVNNAQINMGYALIKAPVEGYIGRIPFKKGSLVGTTTIQPLTILSQITKIYAYFSLSENDFIQFKNQFSGNTIEEKIKQMPPVELVLADNSIYPNKGKVEVVSGQFDNSMGAISFRASFQNKNGLLRSGNTGKIRISRSLTSALVIPQEATYELQDRMLVFVLADSNKVVSSPITVAGKSGNYYFVEKGLKPGQKIVYSGLDRLQDGTVIQAQAMSMDSLIKTNPL